MADDSKRKGFPMMSVKNWWMVRKRFRTAIPSAVTDTYLGTALSMAALSARNNVKPSLRSCGLIDSDDKPTQRAVKWRDDKQYPKVCEDIWTDVYPQELRDLAPAADADRGEVQSWFANHTGAGQSGAGKMASFYMMLLEKDPARESEGSPASKPARTPVAKAPRPARTPAATSRARESGEPPDEKPASKQPKAGPELHINVQIHIAADAGAEQIENIFASMARHLKDFA
jgi:uncharacterized protein DUF5343